MRTIILLPDWNATLFWRDAESSARVDENSLPITETLKRALSNYYAQFSELYLCGDNQAVSTMEKRLLDETGLAVWQQLRMELGGEYRILFHSHEYDHAFESSAEFISMRNDTLNLPL